MKTFTDVFRDAQGQIVIAQWPNYPLWIAIICFILGYLSVPVLQGIGFWGLIISLLYWSFLEISSGVNVWRRFLGIVVALSQLVTLLKLLDSI
ncbi:MAG: hypothetical protein ACJAYE_003009 [Candidatus Azotimanducaceae bacterium]|jgi:hypothetical protein